MLKIIMDAWMPPTHFVHVLPIDGGIVSGTALGLDAPDFFPELAVDCNSLNFDWIDCWSFCCWIKRFSSSSMRVSWFFISSMQFISLKLFSELKLGLFVESGHVHSLLGALPINNTSVELSFPLTLLPPLPLSLLCCDVWHTVYLGTSASRNLTPSWARSDSSTQISETIDWWLSEQV